LQIYEIIRKMRLILCFNCWWTLSHSLLFAFFRVWFGGEGVRKWNGVECWARMVLANNSICAGRQLHMCWACAPYVRSMYVAVKDRILPSDWVELYPAVG